MTDEKIQVLDKTCKTDAATYSEYRKQLPKIAAKIIEGCDDKKIGRASCRERVCHRV